MNYYDVNAGHYIHILKKQWKIIDAPAILPMTINVSLQFNKVEQTIG